MASWGWRITESSVAFEIFPTPLPTFSRGLRETTGFGKLMPWGLCKGVDPCSRPLGGNVVELAGISDITSAGTFLRPPIFSQRAPIKQRGWEAFAMGFVKGNRSTAQAIRG